ncbi:MAG TPA: sugar phosphate nucleotidyltransferase [Fibrobacteria bacterium]|nr:sugar phosphate nucleotidyltransferase [Fibrobacteria bacterium]
MSLDLVVLCAGRGERLRPLTEACPKPLLPLVGMALADRALAACEPLGPVRQVANAHHFPEQILSWAEARHLDHVQVEPVLLDTGGAIGRLESGGDLVSEQVLVHNGDLVHDIDLREPWAQHVRSRADATLVVVDRPRVNTVLVREGRFSGVLGHPRGPDRPGPGDLGRTFSGIAFYRRSVVSARPGGTWSVKELWHDLLEQGRPIHVWEASPTSRWDDLGTSRDFARAVREEMARRGIDTWIDPGAQVDASARILAGSAVECGAFVGAGAVVSDSVLFPGALVAEGETVRGILRNAGGDLPVAT